MDNNETILPTETELTAIQLECRNQLLAQLKANGLDPWSFYAWAMACDMVDSAKKQADEDGEPMSVQGTWAVEASCLFEDSREEAEALMVEVASQLRQMGHSIDIHDF